MLLAFNGESIVYMTILLHMIEEVPPNLTSLPSVDERLRISEQDHGIARSRKQNIQAFLLSQVTNIS
jgi:hypothetical protein